MITEKGKKKKLLRTGRDKHYFTKLVLAVHIFLLPFFLSKMRVKVARTHVEMQVFNMGMEGQFQITAGKHIKIEALFQSKQIGTF